MSVCMERAEVFPDPGWATSGARCARWTLLSAERARPASPQSAVTGDPR